MTWYSDHFYWLPAEGKYDSSIHLYVNDGREINLDMDGCSCPTFVCREKCHESKDSDSIRTLSIEELEQLRDACNRTLKFMYFNSGRYHQKSDKFTPSEYDGTLHVNMECDGWR